MRTPTRDPPRYPTEPHYYRTPVFRPLLTNLFSSPTGRFAGGVLVTVLLAGTAPVALKAQEGMLPLPDRARVKAELRRAALAAGIVPAPTRTPRRYWLDILTGQEDSAEDSPAADRRVDSSSRLWLAELERLWRLPQGDFPVRLHGEAVVQYVSPALRSIYREQRISQDAPLLALPLAAAGGGWQVCIEGVIREFWHTEDHDDWNVFRSGEDMDRRALYRASLGIEVGPFHLEAGRLGRDWSTGHSGGLFLGGETRFFDGVAAETRGRTWGLELFYAVLDPGLTAAERELIPELDRFAFDQYEKSLWVHRLTWRPRPNLRVGLSEGALFYGHRPTIADLGPVLIQHDRYRDFDNLMAELDLLWYPRPGVGLYAELVVDDLRLGTEDRGTAPSALGSLLGLEFLRGPWQGWLEGVWTTDRLYLCRHPLSRWESRLRDGNFTTAWIPDLDQPLGHWLGPDAGALFGGLTYRFIRSGRTVRHGVMPAPEPTINLVLSLCRHRSLPDVAGTFTRPVDLVDPETPPMSRVTVRTLGFDLEWPLPGSVSFRGGLTRVDMRCTPIPEGSGPAITRSGTEYRLELRFGIL